MEKIIVPVPKRLVDLIDEKRDNLSREEFIRSGIDHTLGLKRQTPEAQSTGRSFFYEGREKKYPWKDTFDRTWLFAFLSYGVGDAVSSYIALNRAGSYGDPLTWFLFNRNFYPIIPFKIFILISALLLSYLLLENRRVSLLFPVMFSIAGVFFIIINVIYSIGL